MALKGWQKAGAIGGGLVMAGALFATAEGSGSAPPASQFQTELTQQVGTAARSGQFNAGRLALRSVLKGNMTLVIAGWEIAYAHAGSPNEAAPSAEMAAAEVCGTALATHIPLDGQAKLDYLGALAALNGTSNGSPNNLFKQAAQLCEGAITRYAAQGNTIVFPIGLS